MPTAAIECPQTVIEHLANLNQQARQIQKCKFKDVAMRAVMRKKRNIRIDYLATKHQVELVDITGEADDKPVKRVVRNKTDKDPVKTTDKPQKDPVKTTDKPQIDPESAKQPQEPTKEITGEATVAGDEGKTPLDDAPGRYQISVQFSISYFDRVYKQNTY